MCIHHNMYVILCSYENINWNKIFKKNLIKKIWISNKSKKNQMLFNSHTCNYDHINILMTLQSVSRHFSMFCPTDFLVFYSLLRYRSKCVDLKTQRSKYFLNRHILIDISIMKTKFKNRLDITSRNIIIMSSDYQYHHN